MGKYLAKSWYIIGIIVACLLLGLAKHPLNAPVSDLNAQEVYLIPISYVNLRPSCNCVSFVEQFPKGTLKIRTIEGRGHSAVILKDEGDSWIIIESNFLKCQISQRRLYKDDPVIKYIYY